MIKKLLNKIKSLFVKETKVVKKENNCPYKIERPEASPTIKEENKPMLCEHCSQELKGKESALDENGAKYIWCSNCNYVNKTKDGKIIRKENNGEEVMKAFKLFKKAGVTPSSYSYSKGGEKNKF